MYSFTCYLHKHMQKIVPWRTLGTFTFRLNKTNQADETQFFFVVTKRHNNDKFQIKNINLCPYFGILILLLKSNFHEERTRTTAILNFPVETSQKFLYTSLKVCPLKKSTFRHLFMCFWMSYNGKSKSFPRKFFIFVISIYLDEIFLSGYEHGLIEKSS